MDDDFEKRVSVTCHGCGKVNVFRLFNQTSIASKELVHCSSCNSTICRWGDLQKPEAPLQRSA